MRNWNFPIILTCIAILGGCDAAGIRSGVDEIASLFYESQKNSSERIPQELFSDEQIGMETENQLNRREMAYGAFISRDRIAVNRQISLKGRERKDTFTYVFEVLCEHGRTRETLMISRERSAEPFVITAYVIEDIPRIDSPHPPTTMSAMLSNEGFGVMDAPMAGSLLPSFSSAMSWPESFEESMEVAYYQWDPHYQPHADEDEHQFFMSKMKEAAEFNEWVQRGPKSSHAQGAADRADGSSDKADSFLSMTQAHGGGGGQTNTRDEHLPLPIPDTGESPGDIGVTIPGAGTSNPDYIPPADPDSGNGGSSDDSDSSDDSGGSGNGGGNRGPGNPGTDEAEQDEAQEDEHQRNPDRRVRMQPSPFIARGGSLVYVPVIFDNWRVAEDNGFRGLWGRLTGRGRMNASPPDDEPSANSPSQTPSVSDSPAARDTESAGSKSYGSADAAYYWFKNVRESDNTWVVIEEFGNKGSIETYPASAGYHPGVDFIRVETDEDGYVIPGTNITEGAPIYALEPGVITEIGPHDDYGVHVRIKNDSGKTMLYAHLEKHPGELKKGSFVDITTIIGYGGNTGNSTEAHLHMELYEDAPRTEN